MFFDVFKSLCDAKGISCKRACIEIGLSNSVSTKWKNTGATPNGDTISKVADYFGVSISSLLGEEKEPTHEVNGPNRQAFYAALENMDHEQLLEALQAVTDKLKEKQEK